VLLCVDSRLMAEYTNDAAQFVKQDPRVDIWLTGPTARLIGGCLERELAAELGYRYVPYALARAQWWDLMIFADYRASDRFHPDIPKVLVNHFLGGGKILYGKEYRFERKMWHWGRPLFVSIFEASVEAADRTIASDPRLAPYIRFMGDLRSDRMLELVPRRREVRREIGFSDSDLVVLVQSTWGPQSIMEQCGKELFDEMVRLLDQGKYKFIASTHPHHWHGAHAERHPWGEFLLQMERPGLKIIRPGDDWAKFMVASDVSVNDNTSLSSTYCQLHKPMVFIDLPEKTVPEGSTVHKLYSISPHFRSPSDFERAIDQALADYPMDRLHEVALQVNSFPGEAAGRIEQELYRLLALETPPSVQPEARAAVAHASDV
jgi:hypothetical protein